MRRPRRGLGERGAVTAEFAVATPALLLVVLLGVGALGVGAQQVRLQDATADAARLVARGEDLGRAEALVAAVGGRLEVVERGELVCAVARAPAPVALLPGPAAESCALAGGR